MKIRGGSEAYPIERLDPMIEEEKQFIAKHIDKAPFLTEPYFVKKIVFFY